MNTARIQNTLQALFQDSARWSHPGRRVVFWYDPDQQFATSFKELQLEDVEKLQLADNPFTVKYHLLVGNLHKLFYCTLPFLNPLPKKTGFWIFKKAD